MPPAFGPLPQQDLVAHLPVGEDEFGVGGDDRTTAAGVDACGDIIQQLRIPIRHVRALRWHRQYTVTGGDESQIGNFSGDEDGTATFDRETSISGPAGADLRAAVTQVIPNR